MKATNHQIKQAVNRLMNELVGTDVKIQYMGGCEIFNNDIWVTYDGLCIEMIRADKDISLSTTKAILKARKLLRKEKQLAESASYLKCDTAHSN